MIGPLLLVPLAAVQTRAVWSEGSALAARRAVDFARDVETTFQPCFLTDPPTPIRLAPSAPLMPGQASPSSVASWFDVHLRPPASALVMPRATTLNWDFQSPVPKGARWRTDEECVDIARRLMEFVSPPQYAVDEVSIVPGAKEGRTVSILVKVVLKKDPRFEIGLFRRQLYMDRAAGLPYQLTRSDVPPSGLRVDLERLRNVLPLGALADEAVRVHAASPPLPPGTLSARLMYMVPAFGEMTNEMTEAHRANVAAEEGIPIYELSVSSVGPQGAMWRRIWVDARTGRGIAVNDLPTLPLGGGVRTATSPPDIAHRRWRLGRAVGTVTPSSVRPDGATIPIALRSDRDEIATFAFDAKSGLCLADGKAYRPEPTLLAAMRKEKPPRPFGRVAKKG